MRRDFVRLLRPGVLGLSRSSTQIVNVSCVPPDAIVTVNGHRVTSPAQVQG
jgi:hypothetical protein